MGLYACKFLLKNLKIALSEPVLLRKSKFKKSL